MKCFLLNTSTELLLLNLKVANLYAILAQNPGIPFYRTILSWSVWVNPFPAGFLYCIASSISFYLPAHLFHQLEPWREDVKISQEVRFAAIIATIIILYYGTVVPAYAIFIRVVASSLPPQNDSKAKENVHLGIKSAWQTFSWSARIFFFRTLAKVLLLEVAFSGVLFMLVLMLFDPNLYNDVAIFFLKYAG